MHLYVSPYVSIMELYVKAKCVKKHLTRRVCTSCTHEEYQEHHISQKLHLLLNVFVNN